MRARVELRVLRNERTPPLRACGSDDRRLFAGCNVIRPTPRTAGSPRTGGRLLAGRFRLISADDAPFVTGVYEGVDTTDGTPVSLRAIALAGREAGVPIRLEHEAAVLETLRHPHLAPVLYQGRIDDTFWLVTPRSSATLAARLRSGRLSLPEAISTCMGVLSGLAEIHRHSILHPGIQPGDVLFVGEGEDERAQLSWPGALNPIFHESLAADEILEAARFSAPERSRIIYSDVGEASDLYSVGCLLFHCLVGQPPHDGADLNQLLWRQVTQPIRSLREMGLEIPRVLDEMLQRLLAREVHERYQTAEGVEHDLRELLREIQSGATDPELAIGAQDHRPSLARPAFVARQNEIATLEEQIRRTCAGMPQLTVIEGLSGYGKTRLLSEFAVRSIKAGLLVFEGRASQDLREPFQVLEGIVDGFLAEVQSRPGLAEHVNSRLRGQTTELIAALPRLASVLDCDEPGDASRTTGEARLLTSLVEFLDALGTAEYPAVIILDDAQWADDLLYRLLLRWQVIRAQHSEGSRYVQLVISFRSDEVAAENPLRRIEPGARVEVGPLGNEDMQRLLESMAGQLPDPVVDAVTRLADGSPFMASAILNGMLESNALISEPTGWRVDPLALEMVRSSNHAAAFLSRRLDLLDAETLTFLEAGALLGADFTLEMAIAVSELTSVKALNAVHNARQRQLLWWSGHDGNCTFVHDKVREALLARQDPDRKVGLHSRAADYLAEHSPEAHAELAIHLDAAGRSAEALDHALIAAVEARQQHALELSELQFRIAERAAAQTSTLNRFRIAEGLGAVQMLRGRYLDAETQFNRAAAYASDTESRAEVCCMRGELSIKRGDMDAALSHFLEGMKTIGVSVPRATVHIGIRLVWEVLVQVVHTLLGKVRSTGRGKEPGPLERLTMRMLSGYAHACWYCQSLSLAMWAHLRGMNLGERYAPSLELAQCYSDHAPAMTLVRWIRRGTAYSERSLAIRSELGDLWGQGQSLHYYGVVQYVAGKYEECIESCSRAVRILERLGDYWQVHIARYQIAAARFHLGDLRGALEEANRNHASGLMVGDEQASGIILDVWARATLGQIPQDILRKELARDRHDVQGTVQVLLAAAVQALYKGETQQAVDLLEQARNLIATSGVRNPYTLPVYVWLTTAWRTLAEQDRSLDPAVRKRFLSNAESALRVASWEQMRFRNDRPHVLRERALIAVMRGRPQRARRLFERSLAVSRATGARFQLALTLSEMARIGAQLGWPDTYKLEQRASTVFAEITPTDATSADASGSHAAPSVSLIDRFDTLLKSGRRIISSLSKDAICRKLEDAAIRLLRAEHAEVKWLEDDENVADESDAGPAEPAQEDAGGSVGPRSDLRAEIHVRGKVVAELSVVHRHVAGLFGPDEERIAGFLATLAGAAFENAEGFAKLEQLNATLEQKVAERTASLEQRALELEETTSDLRVARDQLLESTAAAEAANRAKSRFLAAMSHEFRTPMNGMIGMAELALATELSNRQRTYIGTISQSAKTLLAMLNDVLDFSKIEAGKLDLEERPFELHETVIESARLLSVTAWQKGLNLQTRIAPSVPSVIIGDSTRLRQVLLNLLGNAIKFTAEGGVDLSCDLDESGAIHLVVRDTGIGIAKDRLKKIFEAFDQGEASITRRFGGTGLGLSISSQIVSLMDGAIWVESELGKGSEFHVTIPVRLPPDEGQGETQAPPEGRLGKKTLVFTPSTEIGQNHAAWLEGWGYDAEIVSSSNDLKLLLVDGTPFDWLICDISANAMEDAESLAEVSRAGLIDPRHVVVLLPAGAEDAADQIQEANLPNVLVKPAPPSAVRAMLDAKPPASLPVDAPDDAVTCAPEASLRILVVDDSPVNQEVALGLLELMGHQPVAEGSGPDALDRLANEEFDVVLMDIEMPEMDGFETTRRLREQERGRARCVPVFAMSAHVVDEVRQRCLEVGMNGFLSKPVDPDELRQELAALAAESRLEPHET